MWTWEELKQILFKKEKSQSWDLKDLGAIMWPVIYPAYEDNQYNPRDPHITVIQFTDINNPDNGFSKEDIFEVVENIGSGRSQLVTKVTGVEYFGADGDWPVLRVQHPFLERFHAEVKAMLDARGIEYDKRFPEYKPHVSTTAEAVRDKAYPAELWTRPVEVWWGEVHYKFDSDAGAWTI